MTDEPVFSRATVDLASRRAGGICSNPDCRSPTIGASDAPDKAVNVGEAAHIYGAKPRSARFVADMCNAERSDITNAIWLCRNCHKLADNDSSRFPASLLFEWKRQHEEYAASIVGKSGAAILYKALLRMPGFSDMSYLAQEIVSEKPEYWEYKLTIEVLRDRLEPVHWRWQALKSGLYARSPQRVPKEDIAYWFSLRLDDALAQVGAIGAIINEEFAKAWGEPGVAGSETAIWRTCLLVVEACERLLDWEETVKFSSLPPEFNEPRDLLCGIVGPSIERIFDIPKRMSAGLESQSSGVIDIALKFELPENWSDRFRDSLERAVSQFLYR